MSVDPRLCITCSAPNNIAVIKYWGKEDAAANTPINSSVSVTLNQDDLRAITTVAASTDFENDRMWLNGSEEDINKNKRLSTVLRLVRSMAGDKVDPSTGKILVKKEDWKNYKVHISSRNTFPTAAGLASSAAGYACLTFALSELFSAEESYAGELTAVARQGSGSACRSMFGGFVRWNKATLKDDPSDSIAVQISDGNHWPELKALILVTSPKKKTMSSTDGMKTSVETSQLLKFRAENVVERRLVEMEEAYKEKNFQAFGKVCMQDSNQFHATCMDSYPPIFYLNDISRSIIQAVHAYNRFKGKVKACYTFDAGPNAVIFSEEEDLVELLRVLTEVFPLPEGVPLCTNQSLAERANRFELDDTVRKAIFSAICETKVGDVQMIYATSVGDGPRILRNGECLLDLRSGVNCFAPEK